jgi:predicted permease
VRLHPGVSEAQANAEVRAIGARLFHDANFPPGVSAELRLIPLKRGLTTQVRKPVLLLWSAVGLVFLIGCVNVAGLLLARSAVRAREIATRLALGGTKAAITRQLMTESLLLAIFGALAGTLLGALALVGLKRLDIEALGIPSSTISLDAGVLAATALISVLATFIFGLYPALQTIRADIRSALVQGGARGASGSSSAWPRRAMIVAEVALSVMLLVGAGLLIRTFAHLAGLDPGFDSRNVIGATLSLRDVRYAKAAVVNRLYEESLQRIRATPSVEAAGVGLTLPYQRALNDWFTVRNGVHSQEHQITDLTYVTPGYFEALRMRLLRGRLLSESDSANSQPVAIVNQAFVKKYLSGQDALGTELDAGEIVGVVGDVQEQAGWGAYGPLSPVPEIYVPAAQLKGDLSIIHTWLTPWWVVRSRDSRQTIVAALQRAVAATDPLLPFAEFQSMDEVRAQALAFQRLTATLLGVLAGLALALAAVGIYGLISNSVAERTRELGIRMALGASAGRALRTIMLPGLALSGAGLVLGCVLAIAGVRAMRSLIFGVTPNDPITFAGVAVLLLLVALFASAVPGWRVTRIDPAQSLREE